MNAPRHRVTTGLVLVSHSALLAGGAAELAAQMAPDVVLRPAGGTDDARLGTSVAVVDRAVTAVLDAGCEGVVLLADIGSATMTAESVLERRDDPRLVLAYGAFVEGAVAAAVAAQSGGDAAGVVDAVAEATWRLGSELPDSVALAVDDDSERSLEGQREGSDRLDALAQDVAAAVRGVGGAEAGAAHGGAGGAEADGEPAPAGGVQTCERTVHLGDPLGLHARPAARVAALAAGFEARVTLDGADAASMLSIMALGRAGGDSVELRAHGPRAVEAVEALARLLETGEA